MGGAATPPRGGGDLARLDNSDTKLFKEINALYAFYAFYEINEFYAINALHFCGHVLLNWVMNDRSGVEGWKGGSLEAWGTIHGRRRRAPSYDRDPTPRKPKVEERGKDGRPIGSGSGMYKNHESYESSRSYHLQFSGNEPAKESRNCGGRVRLCHCFDASGRNSHGSQDLQCDFRRFRKNAGFRRNMKACTKVAIIPLISIRILLAGRLMVSSTYSTGMANHPQPTSRKTNLISAFRGMTRRTKRPEHVRNCHECSSPLSC